MSFFGESYLNIPLEYAAIDLRKNGSSLYGLIKKSKIVIFENNKKIQELKSNIFTLNNQFLKTYIKNLRLILKKDLTLNLKIRNQYTTHIHYVAFPKNSTVR